MEKVFFYIIFFSFFSFLGWIVESTYRTIREKKFVNSGFLYGPFVPIYGFGALFIYLLSQKISFLPFYQEVIIYAIIATLLEYFSSLILEKIFSLKLWDYSEEPFNLNGRICLKFSLFWVGLVAFYLVFLQDNVVRLINLIPFTYKLLLSKILLIYFAMDTFISSKIFFVFRNAINYFKEESKKEFQPKDYLSKFKLPKEIREFLSAMKRFPNLAKIWNKTYGDINNYTNNNTINWFKEFMKSQKEPISKNDNYLEDETFMRIAKPILENEKYQELKNFHHHENSIYYHSINVAWVAYKIAKVLNAKIEDTIRGALMHDFFLYNWRTDKPSSGKLHAFEHPIEAYNNSVKTFGHLTHIEKDIILKHMWPLTIVPPRYLESFIVSIADKIVATKEFYNEFKSS